MEGVHSLLARPNSAPFAFSLPPATHRRPKPPPPHVACRAASRWADRLFSDFHLLPTAAADPPAAASPSSSPFVPVFPDTADRALTLPVDFYKILGAEPHFLGDGIRRAFESQIAKPPQYGYSTEALVGRRQMLQLAHDTLTNQSSRTEYDRALSEDRDTTLTMDVAWDKVPGVLCVLQEAGEAELVLATGEQLLQDRPPKRFKQDVVLAMALAYVDLSRDAMAASPPDVIHCCEVLERALKLLQIDETLEEITPCCVLELLALPIDEKHKSKRQEGLQGARNILWSVGRGGIATVGGGFSREAFMNEAFLRMTSAEQMDFFSKTPNSIPPEWFEIYSVALAHIAQAIASKRPQFIMIADDLFEQLQKFNIASQYPYENEMDLVLERALCSLLVGDISNCRMWLGIDNESWPYRDPKIIEFVVNNSSIDEENDLLPGLCKLLESWLVSEVFPRSRDTRGMQFRLGDYYDDPKVLSYLERMEGGGASHLAAAAAIAKLGAQATAVLGTVKSSALQAFSKVFPLIEQLDRSDKENTSDDLEKSLEMLAPQNVTGDAINDSRNAALKIISAGALFALFAVIGLKCLPRKKSLPAIRSEHGSVAVVDSVGGPAADEEPLEIPRMDAKLAEDIVRKWQSIKSKALGPEHSAAVLQEVLDGNMLKVWTDRATEIVRHDWFWVYTLSDVTIDSVTVSVDGQRATVEATIEEVGQLTDVADPKNNDSYDTKYTTRYEMAYKKSGGWRITEGAVLKS
ncbi:protein ACCUMULATION AND REPLICATION OF CHLOROPLASTS 6, chloroplastic-like isoform X3 [Panicum virgatum]|uniref:protein ACCUMULATION AND REPLICATION OF CHLOROPLASTS 6, chloroplastic-like isoform X3 n=1 Tax=Panicum virgatum TaxID=38727 RepID=UPI0019D61614|nr:protein ACCUMULATION AND REPLICATION OF CHLOROPLASTS 6, chloroplastic-like isoform X3 [Panicum virgatum]